MVPQTLHVVGNILGICASFGPGVHNLNRIRRGSAGSTGLKKHRFRVLIFPRLRAFPASALD